MICTMKYFIGISLFLLLTNVALQAQTEYSFFVAGHTYGAPQANPIGLHPPFMNKIPYIKSRPEIEMGFLTGDLIYYPTAQDWDEVDDVIDSLAVPIYIAVGNHDMHNRALYESRYGVTYFSFIEHNDLFIVLDPNIDEWNISGVQFDFLDSVLLSDAQVVDNIFVFFHQVLWHDSTHYASMVPNSSQGRADTINFWTEIEPLFHSLSNEVFMFAGDVNAAWPYTKIMYANYDNISFIASGMGSGPKDNMVIVNIDTNKVVSYDLICLNQGSALDCLGELTNHEVTIAVDDINDELVLLSLYPNPAYSSINLGVNRQLIDVSMELYNIQGQLIRQRSWKTIEHQEKIDVSNLNTGVYYLRLFVEKEIRTLKFVKS
jgi:hypothetical protein